MQSIKKLNIKVSNSDLLKSYSVGHLGVKRISHAEKLKWFVVETEHSNPLFINCDLVESFEMEGMG